MPRYPILLHSHTAIVKTSRKGSRILSFNIEWKEDPQQFGGSISMSVPVA